MDLGKKGEIEVNMTAIIITFIICVTLVIMAYFGNQGNERK